MGSPPAPFSDIGKKARDLLTKDYNFDHKFALSLPNSDGMGLTATGLKRDQIFIGDISTLYKSGKTTVDVKVDTYSNVSTKVTVTDILPTTKATLSFRVPDHKSGKLDIQYFHPHPHFQNTNCSIFTRTELKPLLSQLSLPLLWRIFSRNQQRSNILVPKKIFSPLAAPFSVLSYSIPMARSFSNVKLISALVSDGFSSALSRRGYAAAAASQGVASSAVKGGSVAAARNSNLLKKSGEEKVAGSSEKVSWVPDPVTGYYRPENRSDEIDVAELRSILLKNKN